MKPQDYIDRLSTHLKQTIARAIGTATAMTHSEVAPAHLLFALSEETGAVGASIVKKVGITPEQIRSVLDTLTPLRTKPLTQPTGGLTTALPELSTSAKQAIEKAMVLAYEHEHTYIGTEHLLHGLCAIEDATIQTILTLAEVRYETLAKEIAVSIESTNRFPELDDIASTLEDMQEFIESSTTEEQSPIGAPKKKKKQKQQSALETFSTELTSPERNERIDPVIGRETEIERIIHILARRTKNNPVLVGEPGVGKTAIVEGLAKRIAEGTVPPILKHKRIYALDLTLLISGTIYRGEFEARIKHIMEEVAERSDVILFIDEIHNIIGAGSNQGTMDAANILKPALARGELNCIGATTLDEYQKYISADPALARRFQSVFVKEPSMEDAIQILTGLSPYYNTFHRVTIGEDAITAAVELSTKYIHDNFLPDKAIDLLDEAAAAVRVMTGPSHTEAQAAALRESWNTLQDEKEVAIEEERFDDAMQLKKKIAAIETALSTVATEAEAQANEEPMPPVTKQDIARVLATRIGVSLERLLADEWQTVRELPELLKQTVIGQEAVIDVTVQALKKGYLGLTNTKRPIATLLYTGPSGTGKTKLAKALATALYADEKALVRLDMTEFAESHGVSKLLGSPAGYVGYNERNKFLDTIRTRPYSIVLFDEFDKAHPDVRKLLLQILDEGCLTDSTGRNISFEHTIVILTSNIGGTHVTRGAFGFADATTHALPQATREAVLAELRDTFGAELIGRLSDIGIFTPLSRDAITQILTAHVQTMSSALAAKKHMEVHIDDKAIAALLEQVSTKHSGVRSLEQRIDTILQELIIQKLNQKKRKAWYTMTTGGAQGFKLV